MSKLDPGVKALVDTIIAALPSGTTNAQYSRASQYVRAQLARAPKP